MKLGGAGCGSIGEVGKRKLCKYVNFRNRKFKKKDIYELGLITGGSQTEGLCGI